jgi:hypothetical protein
MIGNGRLDKKDIMMEKKEDHMQNFIQRICASSIINYESSIKKLQKDFL